MLNRTRYLMKWLYTRWLVLPINLNNMLCLPVRRSEPTACFNKNVNVIPLKEKKYSFCETFHTESMKLKMLLRSRSTACLMSHNISNDVVKCGRIRNTGQYIIPHHVSCIRDASLFFCRVFYNLRICAFL